MDLKTFLYVCISLYVFHWGFYYLTTFIKIVRLASIIKGLLKHHQWESKRIWRNLLKWWQCRKKWAVDPTSKLQEHSGFKLSWKLCLNLCSLRWLSPSLSLVRNLIPNGSWILNIKFWIGLTIFNKEFLNIKYDFGFLKVISILFYSTIVYGKKEYLNKSVLQLCFNYVSTMYKYV